MSHPRGKAKNIMSSHPNSPFNPTDRMLKQFSGMWILFFGAIAAWQQFRHERQVLALVLALLAVTLGPLGIARPRAMRRVFVAWMALAFPIGWLVSKVVLAVMFYAVFTPMAWAFKLSGRDALQLKRQPDATTYWQTKPTTVDASRYLRQF
jgi:hypothetical protein